jgi:hypothetical protein
VSARPSFWHWPDRALRRRTAVLVPAVAAWFALVYAGADLVTGWRSSRVRVHLDAELALPFVPALFLVYVSPYLIFFFLAPFVLRRRAELDGYAAAVAAVTACAGVCFLLFPAELAYPPAPAAGAWAGLADLARTISLRYNLAPSLHVALTVTAAAVYATHAGPAGRCLLHGYAALVAASTLLTHQHHLLDVLSGWLLGLAGKRLVYDPLSRPGRTPPPSPSTRPAPPA